MSVSTDDSLKFHDSANVRAPVLLLAFSGWGDGGDASTQALRFLLEQYQVENFATIETEEYFDFTVARPHVRVDNEGLRQIVWPDHEFFSVRFDGQQSDLILGLGIEPHMRWKSYAKKVVRLAEAAGVKQVILLGAYLDDVIYSQPTEVGIFVAEPKIAVDLNMMPSSYEGPVGIVGVLGDALTRAGIPALSLWARLPHYIQNRPNSRGALALLQMTERVAEIRFDLLTLEREAGSFDETASEQIANDPQLSAYVRELKKRAFSQ